MTEVISNFLKLAAPAAIVSQAATGVPASITIAQAVLESGWGKSVPAGSNNYFGIKASRFATPDQYVEAATHEFIHGELIAQTDKFARFESVAEGFKAHALLLSMAPRYAPAMAAKNDPAKFAAEIQRCGYSTNPNYAALLIQIVKEFDLTQYDAQTNSQPAAPAEVKA
ncbi:MAG: glycoside hydrolase family 73 protein [Terracidiphilus sp.]